MLHGSDFDDKGNDGRGDRGAARLPWSACPTRKRRMTRDKMTTSPWERLKITQIFEFCLIEYCCSEDLLAKQGNYMLLGCSNICLAESLQAALDALHGARENKHVVSDEVAPNYRPIIESGGAHKDREHKRLGMP